MKRLSQFFLLSIIAVLFSVSASAGWYHHHHRYQHHKGVVEAIQKNKDLSTFYSALKSADLLTTLNGRGPFTVFAPNNEAFKKLSAGTLDNLLKPENKAKLRTLLLNHVAPARYETLDLGTGTFKVLSGQLIPIKVHHHKYYVGANARIVKKNIRAGNGVVQVIDAVLLPKNNSGSA